MCNIRLIVGMNVHILSSSDGTGCFFNNDSLDSLLLLLSFNDADDDDDDDEDDEEEYRPSTRLDKHHAPTR